VNCKKQRLLYPLNVLESDGHGHRGEREARLDASNRRHTAGQLRQNRNITSQQASAARQQAAQAVAGFAAQQARERGQRTFSYGMVDLNAAMDSLVKFAQAANWLYNLEEPDELRDFHRSEYTTFLKECLDMSLESLRQSYKDLAKRD